MKPEKQIYQWDVNQYLTELQPTAEFVDYPMGNEVIRIKADGTRCRIPDEVLQTYGGKTCYERYPDGTFRAYSFSVLYAPKPPDYVYTPEERTTFEALTARVDAAINEIKRRADSGEFTPKKGVDYFTDAEKTELMEGVSSGAVGEFRKVVDTATAEYNDNHNLQLAKYNANASEKLTIYDTNDEQRTSDYNRNAEHKMEAYNQNATTKTAEFDANAAALQGEVDRLRGECDNLAAENRKQENRISALMKLNKGQTYDILPEEGEAASRTAPSGAKYVSVDNVGGKSVVWNQLNNPADNINVKKGTIKLNDDGSITISGTVQDAGKYNELQISQSFTFKAKMKYMVRTNKTLRINVNGHDKATTKALLYTGAADWTGYVALDVADGTDVNIERLFVQVINLTLAFGAGNEPTAEQFETMFPSESYPYNLGEIISSTTANVELEGKNLWDDSDPAFTKILTKSGFTFDGTVWKSELIDYIATPIKIENGTTFSYDIKSPVGANVRFKFTMSSGSHIISKDYVSDGSWKHHSLYLPYDVHTVYIDYTQRASCEIKNIQLERGTVETSYSPHTKQSITTGFPELRSAGTAHDEIDMDGGAIRRNVGTVDLGTLDWTYYADGNFMLAYVPSKKPGFANMLCQRYRLRLITTGIQNSDKVCWGNTQTNILYIKDSSYTEPQAFAEAMKGVALNFELETPTTEPVAIPEPLQEWLPVEPDGTVTFRNADDTKQLPVPNAVSWVRKLDEVE